MGKKPFISKENSVKFDLVFRSSQDAASAPQRELIQKSRGVGIGKPDLEQWVLQKQQQQAEQRYPEGHPLAWLQSEEQAPLSEARRKEIVSLGFPDDGYDYLKHVRQGHTKAASREQQMEQNDQDGGPCVFVPAPTFEPPPDDYKAIDASRLTVHQATEGDDDAALVGQGARVFARELNTVRRRYQTEIDEMEELIKQMEGNSEGEGDLLEDFVISATEAQEMAEAEGRALETALHRLQEAESGDEEEWVTSGSEASSSGHYQPDAAPSENRSFASTYWRPERTDRNANLSVIDERFEQLALEYDSDEIGELDQLADDQTTRGHKSTEHYSKVFDSFLNEHATRDNQFEGGQRYEINAEPSSTTASDADAEALLAKNALQMAKEHVRRLQQEAEPADPLEQNAYSDDDGDARDRWDCESVLTTRSTLYNHPVRLDQRPQRRTDGNAIRLSHKTGLPQLINDRKTQSVEVPETKPSAPQRKHDESAEERRARKALVKDAKREARTRKTELKKMFKEEAAKQRKQSSHAPVSIASLS